MNILYKDQQVISDDIFYNLENCELYNIPTGRGKTFILLDVALRSFKEGHNVVISVSNNYLVREMYCTAETYFNSDGKYPISIRIGKDNYIDFVKLLSLYEDGTLFEYCTKTSLEAFVSLVTDKRSKHGDEDLFFDEFNEAVEYKDIANANMVKSLIVKTEQDEVSIEGITITNHYYLLSKSVHDKNFNIGDYTLLVDEVHEIGDVFMQVNTDSFSFFEYRNVMIQARESVSGMEDFRGKLRLIDALKKQSVRAYRALEKHIDGNRVGLYVSRFDEIDPVRQDCVRLLGTEESKVIQKHKDKLDSMESYMGKINQFKSGFELKNIKTNRLSIGLCYSPSKGYPTLSISAENPLGKLSGLFWKKITRFAGVSGSTTSSFDPSDDDIRYGYSRIGYSRKEDHRTIHFYDRVFDKNNIKIHIADKKTYDGIPLDNVYRDDFDPKNSPYYDKILEKVYLNHDNKNTMIICSGYKEVAYLADLYRLKYNDRSIHQAIPSEKPLVTLGNFRKTGGIFFATKNYATGTSLEGKELEKLFILKLPYPDYTSKFWQELKEKGAGIYFRNQHREMIITLMQTMGRVARTKDDTGDIYIMDHNLATKGKKKRDIMKIIEAYGIVQKAKQVTKKVKKEEMENLFGN